MSINELHAGRSIKNCLWPDDTYYGLDNDEILWMKVVEVPAEMGMKPWIQVRFSDQTEVLVNPSHLAIIEVLTV